MLFKIKLLSFESLVFIFLNMVLLENIDSAELWCVFTLTTLVVMRDRQSYLTACETWFLPSSFR